MSNKKTKNRKVTSQRFFSGIKNPPEDKKPQLPNFQTADHSPNDLLPTTTIIELAKRQGVDFGPGDPQERIRYFIKLGLLPHAIRKTPQDKKSTNPIGHMPLWTIKRLIWVARLSQAGNSYPQIAQKLKGREETPNLDIPPPPAILPQQPTLLVTRITTAGLLALLIVFALTTTALKFGGEKVASFLQVPTLDSRSQPIDYQKSVTENPSPNLSIYAKNTVPHSGQTLGIRDSIANLPSMIYQLASNFFSTILRPFTNLAEVIINGAHQETNYAFQVPGKNQSLTVGGQAPTSGNFLPVDAQGGININGVATFNSLLKAASVSTGSLNVSGNTTLGTDATNTITFNGSVNSDILPSTTNKYSIGSGGQRFRDLYLANNLYIDSENRIGSDGMTTTGSLYIKTGNGGSIYLQSDSGVVYLGKSTNKLTNSDSGSDFTLDASGGGRLCFRNCANYFDTSNNEQVGGNLTVAGSISSNSSSSSGLSGPLTITSTTTPQLSVRYDSSDRLDTTVSSTGAVTLTAVGSGAAFTMSNPLTVSGATTLSSTLAVTGATTLTGALTANGNATIGASSSNTVAYNGRSTTSFVPNATANVDLGTTSLRWNNLWVQTINTTGTNTSGQASFTYQPASTAISEGSILVNPTTVSPANVALVAVAVGGVEKARINSNGYLGLNGANDPGTTYFINAGSTFNVSTAGLLTTTGITSTGAAVSLNASSNFATNINTGTSTGAVSIGNSSAGAIALSTSSTFGVTTTTGAQSHISTNATGTTSSSSFVFVDNSLSSGTGLDLSSTSLTSGKLARIAPTFAGSAVTGYGLYLDGADSTANANTDYNAYSNLALTGNAAKTGTGLYSTVSTSSTTADTILAADLATSTSGVITTGTRNVYGLRTQPASTGASTGGTTNVYGAYSKLNATVGAGGTVNGYGLYVANGTMNTTGTTTQYGLYVETPSGASTNYAAYFAGGNVNIQGLSASQGVYTDASKNLTSSVPSSGALGYWTRSGTTLSPANASDSVQVASNNATGTTTSAGTSLSFNSLTSGTGLYVVSSSLTSGKLFDLEPTFAGSAVTGYGQYISGADSTANANTDYQLYSTLALTGNAAKTGTGLYSTVSTSSTTADTILAADLATSTSGIITTGTRNVYGLRSQPASTGASTGGTTNVYGAYSKLNATVGAGGTVNGYGLYVANGTFNSTGTSTQYGLYVESPSGAGTNYAAIFAGGNVGIGTTAPSTTFQVFGDSTIGNGTRTDTFRVNNTSTINLSQGEGPFLQSYGLDSRAGMSIIRASNNSQGAGLYIGKTRRATLAGAAVTVANNDELGRITFSGDDGTNINSISSQIDAYVDNTVATSQVPGRLRFLTANSSGTLTERVRLDSSGNFGIGTIPSGTLSVASTNATGTTTSSAINLTANSLTSGTGVYVVSTSMTSGKLFDLEPTFAGSAVTGYGQYISGADSTANANTDYNAYSNLALTGNAAKTGTGLYSTVSTSSTTADTILAADLATSTSGVITTGTRNVYGLRTQPASTGASTGGTTNVYGAYSKLNATVGAGGTVNGYGLYVANGTFNSTGTSTQYGLYVESPSGAGTNYAAIFAGGNVGIGTAGPGNLLAVNGTAIIGGISGSSFDSSQLYVVNASSGATTIGLNLINNGGNVANTAVALDFTPNSNVALARITGLRTASGGNTDIVFSNYASSLTETWRITSGGNLQANQASDIVGKSNTTNAFRFTDGTNAYQTIDTRTGTSGVSAFTLTAGTAPSIASAAGAQFITTTISPPTTTFTGTTGITATGTSSNLGLLINQPTLTDASAVTVTEASNVLINGAPVASGAGGVTITTSSALKIPAIGVTAGSGVVTRAYGIYVDAPTGATNNYAATFASGNVGIGTTAPGGPLEVNNGTNLTRFDYINSNINMWMKNGSSDTFAIESQTIASGTTFLSNRINSGAMNLRTTTSSGTLNTNLTILGNGNVGIGPAISSPNNALEVRSTTTPQFRVAYDTSNYATWAASSAGATTITPTGTTPTFTIAAGSNLSSAFKITDGTNAYQTIDTRTGTSGVSAFTLTAGTAPSIASAAGAQFITTTITPPTTTFTGTTGITATGTSSNLGLLINQPTLTDASAVTVTEASNVLINGAPVAAGAGGVTITTSSALKIPAIGVTSGSGVVTNAYGIYVDAPTGATNNYAATFNTGFVGIGTNAPSSSLQVAGGKIRMDNNQDIQFKNSTGSFRSAMFISTSNVLTLSNDALNTAINPTGGSVGIGTASPNNTLEVRSTTTPQFRVAYDTSNYATWAVSSGGANTIALKSNTASDLVINDGTNAYQTIDTRTGTSGVSAFTLATGTTPSIASAAGAQFISATVTPGQVNFTGTTNITGTGTSSNLGLLVNQLILGENGTNTITEASTVLINGAVQASSTSGTNTITTSSALKIPAVAVNGTNGAVTRAYGLYVDAPTGGGSNYAATFASGYVGIGTTSPGSKLQVAGGSGTGGLRVTGTDPGFSTGDSAAFLDYNSPVVRFGQIQGAAATSGSLALYTNNSERVRIDSSGLVGIGTASPNNALEVRSTTTPQFRVAYDTSNYATWAASSAGATTITPTGTTPTFTIAAGSNLSSAFKITDGTNAYQTIDTRTGTSGVSAFTLTAGTAPSIASAAGAQFITTTITPPTTTFTGTTGITATGTSSNLGLLINQPTLTDASAVTVTEASNVLINGAPVAAGAGGVTITTSSALKIPAIGVTAGSGVVTRAYGIYVDAPTGATNNYAATFASGNVGIGTTAPGSSLDVESASIWVGGTNAADSANRTIIDNSTGARFISDGTNTSTKGTIDLRIQTSNASAAIDALFINASGNVLLGGGTNPNNTLEVRSTTTPQFRVAYDTSNYATWAVSSGGANTIALKSNTASDLVINDGTNAYQTIDTRTATSGVSATTFATSAPTIASAATAYFNNATFTPGTVNFSGTTEITSTGTSANNAVLFNQETINRTAAANNLTIDQATNVLISGATIASHATGGQTETITASSALRIAAGSNLAGSNGVVTNGYGIYVDAPAGATNNYAIFTNTGKVQFTCTTASTWTTAQTNPSCSDYAEVYDTVDSSVEAGDIIVTDKQNGGKVKKSSSAYEAQAIGVYSTSPGILIGSSGIISAAGTDIHLPQGKVPVALSGQVPAKVSTENGPIQKGDSLTSSSVPGVAMRATEPGKIIGVALEDYTNPTASGKILVFVNPSWYLGTNLATNGSIATTQTTNPTASGAPSVQLATNITNPDGTLTAQYQGQILTSEQVQKLVREEVARQVAALGFTSGQVAGQATATASATPVPATASAQATPSAALAAATQALADLNKLLSTTNLKVDTLTVGGNTNLAQTQVAGTFSQDGTLLIDKGKQINVLAGTLYLQNDSLAGDAATKVSLDIGGGKVTIDKDGNIVSKGEISASKINIGNQASGASQIGANTTQVQITTPKVTASSLIFITPTVKTNETLAVTTKQEGIGFTVEVATPSPNPIPFNWIVVN